MTRSLGFSAEGDSLGLGPGFVAESNLGIQLRRLRVFRGSRVQGFRA